MRIAILLFSWGGLCLVPSTVFSGDAAQTPLPPPVQPSNGETYEDVNEDTDEDVNEDVNEDTDEVTPPPPFDPRGAKGREPAPPPVQPEAPQEVTNRLRPKNKENYAESFLGYSRILPFQQDSFIGLLPSPHEYRPAENVGGKEKYLLESDINLNFYLFENVTEAFRAPSTFRWGGNTKKPPVVWGKKKNPKANKWREVRTVMSLAVLAHFRTQFRMLREDTYYENSGSNPVRMPSYKPGGSLYLIFRHIPVEVERTEDGRVLSPRNRSWFWGLQAGIEHYSNGQQGCSWSPYLLDGTTECKALWSDIRAQDLRLVTNRIHGDFSGNWVDWGLGFGFAQNQGGPKGDANNPGDQDNRVPRCAGEAFFKIAYEFGGPTGAMNDTLRELYGSLALSPRLRFRYNFPGLKAPAGLEAQFDARIYPNRARRKDTETAGFAHRLIFWLPRVRGLGVFGEFRHGSSPHNLLFADDLKQGMFGMAIRLGEQVITANSFLE